MRNVLQRKNLEWRKANFAHDKETIVVFRTFTRRIGSKGEVGMDLTRGRDGTTDTRMKRENPNDSYHSG